MRKTLGFLLFIVLISAGFFGGCKKGNSVEQAEGVAAMETASQMEAAKEGRSAARVIINKEWTDSMELQQAILDARSKNSKYEMKGDNASKAAFDSAFFSTIRTVRPDLEKALRGS